MPCIIAPDIADEDLSAYVNELQRDDGGNLIRSTTHGWKLTPRGELARLQVLPCSSILRLHSDFVSQAFVEETKQYPPMEQLPTRYDAAITKTSAILSFGLGVTYDQLLGFVNKRNIRAPWAPDQPITRPIVAYLMIVRHLRTKIRGLSLFYRRPMSPHYDMLLALYSNHSFRTYQYHDESQRRIIEIMKKELDIDSPPMWYWDMGSEIF